MSSPRAWCAIRALHAGAHARELHTCRGTFRYQPAEAQQQVRPGAHASAVIWAFNALTHRYHARTRHLYDRKNPPSKRPGV